MGGSIWALSWETAVSGVGNRKSGDGPGPLDWLKVIARSDLPKREKAVLNAMAIYITYGEVLAECYPSIATLVRMSGWSERAIQDSMLALEERMVVSISPKLSKQKTSVRTLDYHALDGLNPARPAGSSGSEPSRGCPLPLHTVPPPPAGAAPQPRRVCTQSNHVPTIELSKELEADSQATNGMDGAPSEATRKRRAHSSLKDKGVQGKNLNELASCERVTPEMIEGEWYRISQDPNVRNATAVLVRKLAEIAEISLGSKKALADMPPKERAKILGMQARIESLRRNRQREAS
jgi:hypothetical protein